MQRTLDVLPTPGGPDKMRLGMVPCETQERRVLTLSVFPKTSSRCLGLYFSNQIYFIRRDYILKTNKLRTIQNLTLN